MYIVRKNISIVLAFVVFITSPLQAYAQSSYDIVGESGAGLLGSFGGSGSYDIPFNEKGQPEDLYALMLNQVKNRPPEVTIKRLKDGDSLTEDEKELLLSGGDVTLLQKGGLDQAVLRTESENARTEFNLESELAKLELSVEAEVTATEIFADGDISNSGFDLLYDLEIIHIILFGESTTLFGSNGVGGSAGANELSISDLIDDQKKREEDAAKHAEDIANQAKKARGTIGNPAVCFADESLEDALARFNRASDGEAGAGDDLGFTEGAFIDGEGYEGDEGSSENEDILPAPASDWARSPKCFGPTCIFTELKMIQESARPAEASCIACHIEKINDAYKKTTRRNLMPSKASGNLMEVPLCKKGFNFSSMLDVNLVLFPSPILTPSNDDVIIKHGLSDELSRFSKKYFGNPEYTVSGLRQDTDQPVPDLIGKAERRALSSKSDTTDVQQVVRDINTEVAKSRNDAAAILREFQTLAQAENYSSGASSLMSELNTMNAYFKSYQAIFNKIETPCEELLDEKAYCE